MNKFKNILWGIALVAVGVLFVLKVLDIVDFNIFFDGWWTLFIIVPCIIGLFTDNDKTGSLIGTAIGVFLLLGCQDIIGFDKLWKLLIPSTVVIIGLKMIFGGIFGAKTAKEIYNIETDINPAFKTSCAIFSGNNMIIDSEVFEGAELTAVFGGIKCDLKKAIIEKDCLIKVSAVFGGIDILLPDNVNVKTNSTSIFGGMSNKTPIKANAPTVYVSGTCMFGGVDIK